MVIIFAKKGFVKLLGLGHIIAWIPLLVFFAFTLINNQPDGLFRIWLISIIVLNGISLIIDIVRYFIEKK